MSQMLMNQFMQKHNVIFDVSLDLAYVKLCLQCDLGILFKVKHRKIIYYIRPGRSTNKYWVPINIINSILELNDILMNVRILKQNEYLDWFDNYWTTIAYYVNVKNI